MQRTLSLIVSACLLVGGCGARDRAASTSASGQRPQESAGDAALRPVALPDVSQLAEPVQRQLRERLASLTQKLRNSDTPQADLAEAYGDLGRLLLAARLGSAAGASFLHAQLLAPRDRRWPYYLGHVSLLVGDRAQAIKAFERATALAPSDLAALVWLGEAHLDDGRPAEAESLFLKAVSLHPGSAAARFGAGRAALARQAYPEAVQHFEEALALDGQASAVHYPLAMAYRALGERQKAESHLRQRGESWPGLPDPLMEGQGELLESVTAYERRGVEAFEARDWPAAAAAFRKGLDLEPGDAALRERLARTLYAAGDVEGAVREFEEIVRRTPDFARAHVGLGTILNLRGRYQEAIAQFSAALDADAGSVDARLGLAEALRVSGQPEASLGHYAQAIRLDPAIAEAWVGRALALIALRRNHEAREWLAEARRVHPNQPKLAELAAIVP